MGFPTRQVFWIAFLIIAVAFLGGAILKIEQAKDIRSDMFYAKDLALILNEVGSAKGEVVANYYGLPDFTKNSELGTIKIGTTGLYYYIKGDKEAKIDRDKESGKTVITNV